MVNVDVIASTLGQMGQLARSLPPAWDGGKVTALATGPDGQVFGKMLPGRGLYLARDLRYARHHPSGPARLSAVECR
jgi:hypothetical protein